MKNLKKNICFRAEIKEALQILNEYFYLIFVLKSD